MTDHDDYGSDDDQLHFVLVHGAGHGGWCWYKIRAHLEAAGHKVTCPDLLCSGIESTDFNTVFQFADYNEPLTSFMSSLPPKQKVIVVGHSIGGLSVTDVIIKFAEKIHFAVYVAAAMYKPGRNITSSNQKNTADMYEYIYGLGPDQPPTGVMIKPELRRSALYNMSPTEDYTLASMLLRASPARALLDGMWFEEAAGAESVARVYIRTLNDHLMPKEEQDYMINNWPPSCVFAVESDHSMFFSNPDALLQILLQAAADFVPDFQSRKSSLPRGKMRLILKCLLYKLACRFLK